MLGYSRGVSLVSDTVHHGRLLAGALLARGIAPGRLHLVGQSAGSIVAASAANSLRAATGQPIGQITLLDPAAFYHDIVFGRLAVGSCARSAEHYWAPGPTGFSRAVGLPGVRDQRVDAATTWRGALGPLRSAHVNTVRWYIGTAADPSNPGGFNTSFSLRGAGDRGLALSRPDLPGPTRSIGPVSSRFRFREFRP